MFAIGGYKLWRWGFYVYSFGGAFDRDFDSFLTTKAKQFHYTSFVDIFDAYDNSYQVSIINRPRETIDYGTDWKETLLSKASLLNLYKSLVLHDNNNIPLPFSDNFFQTVYSNSIYRVKRVDLLLLDIYRVLRPGGIAVLEVMTPYLFQTLDELAKLLTQEAIAILDRKRRETMPGGYMYDVWQELIKSAGFKIIDIRCVYPNKLLLDIWNIGLRPISHLLVQAFDSIPRSERLRIKNEWIKIFYTLFRPLLSIEQTYHIDKCPYKAFVLSK